MIYTIHNVVPGTKVYVDGVEVKHVFYVDTVKGFVDHYVDPIRLREDGELDSRCLHSTDIVIIPPGNLL